VTRLKLFPMLLAAAVAFPAVPRIHAQSQSNSSAQQSSIDQDVDLLRKDVRSQKKQIIAANLQLTDAEAEKFWPIYDQYTAELVKINDAKYGAIKEYVQNYDTLTDERATALTKQIIAVDAQAAQLREKYVPIVNKVLSGKKTALFFQLDRRLVMLIDIQLATQLPMVQP
jgi:Spy/CpxP family protein refolding chaperone